MLLLRALVTLRYAGIRAVLVWSDSPTWKPHIEEHWLPRIRSRVVLLNWSERRRWTRTLEVLLWRHFCGHYESIGGCYGSYNPAVIVLRGLRDPIVLRFFRPFRAMKKRNSEPLRDLETTLFSLLDG